MVGRDVWPHKPLEVFNVDGKLVIHDVHHRYEAAKMANYQGQIPYTEISFKDTDRTLEEVNAALSCH